MSTLLIKNATIINEGKKFNGSVLIENDLIKQIITNGELPAADKQIDATGLLLLPGAIDDQVHFREPGLTHKANIESESKAAVAGGITSFMEMPNTKPQATTHEVLEEKYKIAAASSAANYSFFLGATNDNIDEILKINPQTVCGVKVFMGSSTGNMLVDNEAILSRIFAECPTLIATHCEDEDTIQENTTIYKNKFGEDMPFKYHPVIRSAEACYKSSKKASDLARKHGARLHILHLSSAEELELLDQGMPLSEKKITGEVCVHHLWFTDADYDKYGSRIKWNPAVKAESDRNALRKGLLNDTLDVVATDHAPHTIEEKNNKYFSAPSGGPLVQHALVSMLEMVKQGIFSYELVTQKMSHNPAILFQIDKRGFIREGYKADLVLVDPNNSWEVKPENILYKCGWSPFEGTTFSHKVMHTLVNGQLAYTNDKVNESIRGERLSFNR
ncbi:dihydroorotase [Carboxylicivirga sediminis]|uniref:Dihydroorotase n=1 Tax=Carboxylicivirga sediminis TaxID=2006564 RepID=A0A941F0W4_9BACT|nr:dihydroorotase [Carboxylicivirga sediminis]MBR8534218.1 dihydroorotase [Carboxylicivirga sediminis]